MRVQPKSHKKTIIITIVTVAILLVASLLWYYAFSSRDTGEVQNSTKSEQNNAASDKKDDQKADSQNSDKKTGEQSVPHEKEKELPQLYEGENSNTSSGLTGVITTKSVVGETLVIRNTINQMISSGTCELTLTSSSRTVNKSAEIIQNPSSSACAGFDIPVSELAPGQWSLELKVSSEGKTITLKEAVSI